MTHDCPAPGCPRRVPPTMLMCRDHWYQVPSNLRAAVWRAWDHGNGAGTLAHWQAMQDAIASVGGA